MVDGTLSGRLRAFVFVAGVALAGLAAPGCSEDPTEANALAAALPLADLVVRDTTFTATGSSTFRQYVAMDGGINLLGRTGNYEAFAAMNFYPSLFPLRDTALIYQATLKLRFITWFGDSTGQFSFNVYRITRGWSESGVTWDTVQAGFFDQSSVRGSSTTGAGRDTQVVSVKLDTAMVREWFKTPTSADTRYGILLAPTPSCAIVRGFTAFVSDSLQYQPQLEVVAGSPTGPQRDTVTYNQGIDTFVGNVDNLNTNPQLLYVQAGVDYRATLNFNVVSVPQGAIINSAELLLQRDPTTSRIPRFTTDTAFTVQTSLSSSDRTLLDQVPSIGRRKAGLGLTFTADVRRMVQLWVRGPNYGLTLRPSGQAEYTSFALLTFHNEQAANPALRPKLKIIYSTPRQKVRP